MTEKMTGEWVPWRTDGKCMPCSHSPTKLCHQQDCVEAGVCCHAEEPPVDLEAERAAINARPRLPQPVEWNGTDWVVPEEPVQLWNGAEWVVPEEPVQLAIVTPRRGPDRHLIHWRDSGHPDADPCCGRWHAKGRKEMCSDCPDAIPF